MIGPWKDEGGRMKDQYLTHPSAIILHLSEFLSSHECIGEHFPVGKL